MFDGKFLATLMSLLIAVMIICNFSNKESDKVVETWDIGCPTYAKPYYFGTTPDGGLIDIPNSARWGAMSQTGCEFLGTGPTNAIGTGPNFQKAPPPRMMSSGNGIATYTDHNPEYMAFETTPQKCGMNKMNMVKEGYKEEYGPTGCGNSCGPSTCSSSQLQGGVKPVNIPGNYDEVLATVAPSNMVGNTLPIGSMKVQLDGSDDTVVASLNMGYMFSTRKRHGMSQGDPIRGDVPIVPCHNGWFNTAASMNPSESLQTGALAVMGGGGDNVANIQAFSNVNTGKHGNPAGPGTANPAGPTPYDTGYGGPQYSEMINAGALGMTGKDFPLSSSGHDGTLTAHTYGQGHQIPQAYYQNPVAQSQY
jgi:hypothetical protein